MNNLIEFDGIKYWADQNIIPCELNEHFDFQSQKGGISKFLDNTIMILSNDRYPSILINLKEVRNSDSIKGFKFFYQNLLNNTSVLSKTSVVRTFGLQSLFIFCDLALNDVVPNKIYSNMDMVINYCNEGFMMFNMAN